MLTDAASHNSDIRKYKICLQFNCSNDMSQKLVVMWSVNNINKYLIDREIIVGCDDNFCWDNWIDMLDCLPAVAPDINYLSRSRTSRLFPGMTQLMKKVATVRSTLIIIIAVLVRLISRNLQMFLLDLSKIEIVIIVSLDPCQPSSSSQSANHNVDTSSSVILIITTFLVSF